MTMFSDLTHEKYNSSKWESIINSTIFRLLCPLRVKDFRAFTSYKRPVKKGHLQRLRQCVSISEQVETEFGANWKQDWDVSLAHT